MRREEEQGQVLIRFREGFAGAAHARNFSSILMREAAITLMAHKVSLVSAAVMIGKEEGSCLRGLFFAAVRGGHDEAGVLASALERDHAGVVDQAVSSPFIVQELAPGSIKVMTVPNHKCPV